MNENTTKLIEQLAEKMGTTSQYLWSILIRQAPIDATITLIQMIMSIMLAFALLKAHKYFSKEDEDKYSYYERYDGTILLMGVATFIVALLLICCFFCIGDVINGYFNPEYWALDKVISSLHTK